METMLYASAERQIKKAILRVGIKPQTQSMAIVIIGDDPRQIESTLKAVTKSMGSEPDESVLDLTKDKEEKIKVAFEITDEELKVLENGNQKKAIINLVIEHVALLVDSTLS